MADENEKRRNYLGEDLGENRVELQDPAFGTGEWDDAGNPVVKWEEYRSDDSDNDGFLKKNRETVILPEGTRIIRYGPITGSYSAPYGVDFDLLGLPYQKETCEYHEYIVQEQTEVVFDVDEYIIKEQTEAVVDVGIVAPIFNSSGIVLQYKHPKTIGALKKSKIIKEDEQWLERIDKTRP